jgi:phage terminase large subunit-like protein
LTAYWDNVLDLNRATSKSTAPPPPKRTSNGRRRAQAVIDFIEQLTIPSGVGQGGPMRLESWQKEFIRDIYEPHIRPPHGRTRRVVRRAILSIARKNGKDLDLNTPIPTPSGWVTMGKLKVGDIIFDENGRRCRVTYVSPVFVGHRCWRLRFADGSEIVAGNDHQWVTQHKVRPETGASGHSPRQSIVTTGQIAASLYVPRNDAAKEHNHKVKVADALELPEAELPLAPYVLGYWLGNGHRDGARVTSGEDDGEEISRHCEAALGFATGLRVDRHGGASRSVLSLSHVAHRSVVVRALRSLDVTNKKHIPQSYLWSSRAQRLSLLQGLMDSDGSVSGNPNSPRCYFENTNHQLALDVLQLVRSLGFKASIREDRATLNGRDMGPAWSVSFTAFREDEIFLLRRKNEALLVRPSKPRSRHSTNAIVACDEVPSVPTVCIQVDSPSRLFLAGEGFTPTHNTALIAAIVLAHLVGPEAIPNGEIYSAANDRDQAGIVFKFARQFVEAEPELLAVIEVIGSTKTMIARRTGSVYRAVSAEAGTKHGYLPSLVIYDELAQAKKRDLYDVLDTSFGAREEPLFVIISTQSNDPEHILSKLIDDAKSGADPSIICHLYAAEENCDLADERQWRAANPALGTFRDKEDLAVAIRAAIRQSSEEPKVRNLFLNQRVSPYAPLVSRAEWEACIGQVEFAPGEEVYLALDLSSVNDLTALAMGSVSDPCRVQVWFWKPEDKLIEHSARDFGAGEYRYMRWHEKGFLNKSPGRSINPAVVALHIANLHQKYRIRALAYDLWRIDELLRVFDSIGLQAYKSTERGDGLRLVTWGQGFRDMGPAVNAMLKAILDRQVVHNNNPVLNWNMANAVSETNETGEKKLVKNKSRFRIDGAVTVCMLMGLRARDRGVKPVDIEALIG